MMWSSFPRSFQITSGRFAFTLVQESAWLRRLGHVGTAAPARTSGSTSHDVPAIAILGCPNVGKSTLFNRLCKRRTALVYDTPDSHVTRDWKEGTAILSDLTFRVIDTSGLEPLMTAGSVQGRALSLTQQVLKMVDGALFLIDARGGLTGADVDAAQWLRAHGPSRERIIVVAAKFDHPGDAQLVANALEATSLGLGDVVPYSAETQAGTTDLYDALRPIIDAGRPTRSLLHRGDTLEAALEAPKGRSAQISPFSGWRLVQKEGGAGDFVPIHIHSISAVRKDSSGQTNKGHRRGTATEGGPGATAGELRRLDRRDGGLGSERPIELAIVGLPNVGKSTLMNRLLGFDRSLTGAEAGLTRDAVSEECSWRDTRFRITDTAGWMRKSTLRMFDSVGGHVAALTVPQGEASVAFAHAVLLLIDGAGAAAGIVAARADTARPLSRRELDLAGSALAEGRLLIIAANKLDAVPQAQRRLVLEAIRAQVDTSLASWRGCVSVMPLSGMAGTGLDDLLERVLELVPLWTRTIPTSSLNKWLHATLKRLPSPFAAPIGGARFLKMVKTRPPTVVAEFRGRGADTATLNALGRALRVAFGLSGVPLRVMPLVKVRRRQLGTEGNPSERPQGSTVVPRVPHPKRHRILVEETIVTTGS